MASYFSVEGITPIQSLAPQAKIHIIGICGVAMAPLAAGLSKKGFKVSGSDREYYEPMASMLKKHDIRLYEGFDEKNINKDLDLVVIGNIAGKDHPEVLAVEQLKLPYTIFTQSLFDILIKGRHSIVVSGTHGKTTTTALCATTLQKLTVDASYFIGGEVKELTESFHEGSAGFSVVEGDEYDSAFFAKVPKFSFYHPNTLIITSIEYDHADIYPDLESIEKEFSKLVAKLTRKDTCICCIDNVNIRRLLGSWKRRENGPAFITYGLSADADINVSSKQQEGSDLQQVAITTAAENPITNCSYQLPLSGSYNALNSAAIMAALKLQGFDQAKIAEALKTFKGVRRRQELVFDDRGIKLIEDFAHHPTAVKETLQGLKAKFPDYRIIAIFEPRSGTSRRPVFREPYNHAFNLADRIIIGEVVRREIDKDITLLESKDLTDDLKKLGKKADVYATADEISRVVGKEVKKGDIIVVMSNGSFGGLISKIRKELESV